MTCSGGTDTSVKNASTTPKSYTLDELQQEIAKDKDWRTAFRYVLRVSKTNLKFHRMPQILAKPCLLPERLLIGGSYKLGSKGKRVYAEVFRSPGGAFNLVDIRHCNDTKTALHRSLKDEEVKMLQSVVYVEPFNLLEKAGSTGWRKCVRFLLLYYFLEQHTLTKLVFTSDGLEALKRACTSIAAQSQRITKPPLRLRWKGPKPGLDQEAKPEKTESRISSCARDENIGKSIIMKQESLSKFTPVKAPENDSTRAVSTMILEDDKVASLLLPELGRSSEDSLKNEDSKTHAMAIPEHTITTSSAPEPQLKRKRSTDDTSENANTELIFDRCKQIIHLKGKRLAEDETALQNTLNEQSSALTKAHVRLIRLHKDLKEAQAKSKTAEEAKTVTETQLRELRKELASHRLFEQGFDTYRG